MPISEARLDETPLRVGKYKGNTPLEISDFDPAYLVWAYDTWALKPCSRLLRDACSQGEDDNPDSLGHEEY